MQMSHRSARLLAACGLALAMTTPALGDKPNVKPNIVEQPAAMTHQLASLKQVDQMLMAPLDFELVQNEDIQREAEGQPPRYAVPHEVQLNPDNSGTWDNAGENLVWRLRINSAGARHINFGFTDFFLPESAVLHIYSADMAHRIRAFTSDDNNVNAQLWTPPVSGDEIVIELTIHPKALDKLSLELGSINIGYRGFRRAIEDAAEYYARSGSCNLDVVCSAADGWPEVDNWRDIIPSVAVISTGGSTFCTGFMVNNTANDRTPYFMTAYHCGIRSGNAASLVTFWNYENSFCRQPFSGASGGPGNGVLNQFNTGAVLRAESSSSDMTLVQLNSDPNPDWGVSFAGWNATGNLTNRSIAIHHPNTDEKRISFDYDPPLRTNWGTGGAVNPSGTHVLVQNWEVGTTEPGSSGSPLFDGNGRVIGQLHGGTASCSSITYDAYGGFDTSWNNSTISTWLDPINSGALTTNTLSGQGLTLDPNDTSITSKGVVGGPFTNTSNGFTATNNSPDPIDYEVSILAGDAPIFIDGSQTMISGTVAEDGGTFAFTIDLDSTAAGALGAGVYSTDVLVDDTTNDRQTTITFNLEVGLTGFSVTPSDTLYASGPLGGPSGPTIVYTVTSTQPSPVDVSIVAADNWVSLDGATSPVSFTLSGEGASQDVLVGIDQSNADALGAGLFTSQVNFNNLSGGSGATTRAVTLDAGRIVVPSTDTPIPITDNSSFNSIITVTQNVCIADIDVDIDITHTFIGDLRIILTSPEGTSVTLHNRTGGSADDIVTTYDDDTNPPDGPGQLADFNGEFSAGNWVLNVSDNATLDTGTLNSWAVRIGASGTTCPPTAPGDTVEAPTGVLTAITLPCNSGDPISDYTILSLPQWGQLFDPNSGPIITTPHTLAAGGNVVNYQSDVAFAGDDSFTYRCSNPVGSLPGTINILVGFETAYFFPLDTDPGFQTQGLWAFGPPVANGGNPGSAYTGDNVYGYNLNGQYTNNMPETYLTAGPLDLSDYTQLTLSFYRWLGIENSIFDNASVRISNDGVNWTTIWQHSGGSFTENQWSFHEYDISAVADEQSTVYIRWVMGTTDSSVTFCGWNIDDIRIVGANINPAPTCPGDINGDGFTNLDDFIILAGNFGATSGATLAQGDLNGDGAVNLDDFIILAGDFGCGN